MNFFSSKLSRKNLILQEFKKVFFLRNSRKRFRVNSSLDANDGVANWDVLGHGLLKILGVELRGMIVDVYHVDGDLKKLVQN
jgi:hypothetical protein